MSTGCFHALSFFDDFQYVDLSLPSLNLFLTIFLFLFGMMTCSRFNTYLLA